MEKIEEYLKSVKMTKWELELMREEEWFKKTTKNWKIFRKIRKKLKTKNT